LAQALGAAGDETKLCTLAIGQGVSLGASPGQRGRVLSLTT
jgi:hypothetical protein